MEHDTSTARDEESCRYALTQVYAASFNEPRFSIGDIVFNLHYQGVEQGRALGLPASMPIEAMRDQILFITALEEAANVVSNEELANDIAIARDPNSFANTLRLHFMNGELRVWVAHLYMRHWQEPVVLLRHLMRRLEHKRTHSSS